MTNWWLFPPQTREVQYDEKWSFVHNKEENCGPGKPSECCGDNWDHTAIDPEHRLLLALVPGKRSADNCEKLVAEVQRRTGGRADMLHTSDEYKPYKGALEKVYGQDEPVPRRPGPGRPPKARKVMPPDMCYATVRKRREKGRVVEVLRTLVFGTAALLDLWLTRSTASHTINTSFVERNNGTDRGQNARKVRKSYCFSKDWELHNAASFYIAFSYNFCWAVRTLGVVRSDGTCLKRTPAMAAGLTDHVWSIQEWASYPAKGP